MPLNADARLITADDTGDCTRLGAYGIYADAAARGGVHHEIAKDDRRGLDVRSRYGPDSDFNAASRIPEITGFKLEQVSCD